MSRLLHVLTGCTAVGKTELALRWAESNGAEIVSCDSLLFYRGMDIGTAKPTPAELARVPHHLINVRDVREQMDVTYYVSLARQAVEVILARGRQVLVTGGSGFYLKAFFAAVADDVAVPAELRTELRDRLEKTGLDPLLAELKQLNPGGLGALDIRNPRRVLRALERCRVTGMPLLELQAEFAIRPGPFADFEVRLCELERPADELTARVESRVHAMLRAGLVEEVRRLIPSGLRENSSAAGAIGYRETLEFFEGKLSEPELTEAIIRNTRALVRKQRTWFRTQLPAHQPVPAATAEMTSLFSPAR